MMGTYTELIIKCLIKLDIPIEIHQILDFLFNSSSILPRNLPDHDFFRCPRWKDIGRCNSYYHIPRTFSYFETPYLFSRSDLKNYDNEIEKFLDWIDSYVDSDLEKGIGWIFYEGAEKPLLITYTPKQNLLQKSEIN